MHNSAAYAALLASNNKRTAQATALVRLACAISFLDMLGYGFLSPITYSLLNKDVIGATGFGALQSVSNAAALLAGAALGRLSDTRGRKPAIVASAALSLLGYALYIAFMTNPPGVLGEHSHAPISAVKVHAKPAGTAARLSGRRQRRALEHRSFERALEGVDE